MTSQEDRQDPIAQFLGVQNVNTTDLLTTVALIQEDICIGCTKCIKACPTDAIVGANQEMHTVLTDDCIGCGACAPVCPMECISFVPHDVTTSVDIFKQKISQKIVRIRQKTVASKTEHEKTLKCRSERQKEIQEAIKRVEFKKGKCKNGGSAV